MAEFLPRTRDYFLRGGGAAAGQTLRNVGTPQSLAYQLFPESWHPSLRSAYAYPLDMGLAGFQGLTGALAGAGGFIGDQAEGIGDRWLGDPNALRPDRLSRDIAAGLTELPWPEVPAAIVPNNVPLAPAPRQTLADTLTPVPRALDETFPVPGPRNIVTEAPAPPQTPSELVQAFTPVSAPAPQPPPPRAKKPKKPDAPTVQPADIMAEGSYSYSPSQLAAENLKQGRGTYEQMRKALLSAGAKEDELQWSGFDATFSGRPDKITREEVQDFFEGYNTNRADVTPPNTPYALAELFAAGGRTGQSRRLGVDDLQRAYIRRYRDERLAQLPRMNEDDLFNHLARKWTDLTTAEKQQVIARRYRGSDLADVEAALEMGDGLDQATVIGNAVFGTRDHAERWFNVNSYIDNQLSDEFRARISTTDGRNALMAELGINEFDPGNTSYSSYAVPGMEDYRERIFYQPREVRERAAGPDLRIGFRSPEHFSPRNQLWHTRVGNLPLAETPDILNVRYLSEIQSDAAQRIRAKKNRFGEVIREATPPRTIAEEMELQNIEEQSRALQQRRRAQERLLEQKVPVHDRTLHAARRTMHQRDPTFGPGARTSLGDESVEGIDVGHWVGNTAREYAANTVPGTLPPGPLINPSVSATRAPWTTRPFVNTSETLTPPRALSEVDQPVLPMFEEEQLSDIMLDALNAETAVRRGTRPGVIRTPLPNRLAGNPPLDSIDMMRKWVETNQPLPEDALPGFREASKYQQANRALENYDQTLADIKANRERTLELETNRSIPSPYIQTTPQWLRQALQQEIQKAIDDGMDWLALPDPVWVERTTGGRLEGHKGFYGNIAPKELDRIVRSMGSKEGVIWKEVLIGNAPDQERVPVPMVRLTPQMASRMKAEGFKYWALPGGLAILGMSPPGEDEAGGTEVPPT